MEEFIKKNRAQFDDEFPSMDVWSGIQKELNSTQKVRFISWKNWAVAASFLLVLGCSLLFVYQSGMARGEQHYQEIVSLQQFYEYKLLQEMEKLPEGPSTQQVKSDLLNAHPQFTSQPLTQSAKETQLKMIIQDFEHRIKVIEKIIEHQRNYEKDSI